MTLRTLRFLTAAAVSIGAALTAAPASAAPSAPNVSALDLSVPGHVSGTVTSTAPWVAVTTGSESAVLPTSGGDVAFDLTTWGLSSATLQVYACTYATGADCSQAVLIPFTPTDTVPEITWPADRTVGSTQEIALTIDDPDGGGELVANWLGNPGRYALDRNGTTILDLPDGSADLEVVRCDADDWSTCSSFTPVQEVALSVRRTTQAEISVAPGNLYNGSVSTAQPTVNRVVNTFQAEVVPYTLAWHLESGGVEVAGTADSQTGSTSAAGAVPFAVGGEGVADGTYAIVGTLTLHLPEYGDVIAATTGGSVTIDRTAPTYTSRTQSRTKIFPYVNAYGYSATVRWEFTGVSGNPTGNVIEIRASNGSLVNRVKLERSSPDDPTWQASWTGRSSATSKPVAAGTYSGTLLDAAGNPGPGVGWVTVSDKKLVYKTFRKKVQASGSTVGKYVGTCSTLKRPVRGWVGSQGYYANTKCGTQTSKASEVNTVHEMKLPAAVKYLEIRVETYGGSALSKPGSRGVVAYLENTGKWLRQSVTGTTVKTHLSPNATASRYIWPDRYFVWGFATAFGHRFDVRDFTVVLKYYVVE